MKAQHEQGTTPNYQIEIKGHLEAHWTTWFAGFILRQTEGGNTMLVGSVSDQAALHGLLRKIHHVGLTLVSVNQQPPDLESNTGSQEEV